MPLFSGGSHRIFPIYKSSVYTRLLMPAPSETEIQTMFYHNFGDMRRWFSANVNVIMGVYSILAMKQIASFTSLGGLKNDAVFDSLKQAWMFAVNSWACQIHELLPVHNSKHSEMFTFLYFLYYTETCLLLLQTYY